MCAVVLAGLALIRITGFGTVSDADRAANAKPANSAGDFDSVCTDGSVSNAAAYSEPYKVIAFQQGFSALSFEADHISWSQVTLDRRPGIYDTDDPVTAITVVACVTRQKGSEVRSGSCDFNSSGRKVTAEHYAVKWDVELREAKTGKSITTLEPVDGPATDCPLFATFDPDHPKVYADPDTFALTEELRTFPRK